MNAGFICVAVGGFLLRFVVTAIRSIGFEMVIRSMNDAEIVGLRCGVTCQEGKGRSQWLSLLGNVFSQSANNLHCYWSCCCRCCVVVRFIIICFLVRFRKVNHQIIYLIQLISQVDGIEPIPVTSSPHSSHFFYLLAIYYNSPRRAGGGNMSAWSFYPGLIRRVGKLNAGVYGAYL